MLSLKRSIIIALLIVDGMIGGSVVISGITFQALVGFLFLNAVVGGPGAVVLVLLAKKEGSGSASKGLFSFGKSQKKKASAPLVTLKGETVKSAGEKKVADYLYSRQIPYTYEAARMGPGGRMRRSAIYLVQFNTYVLVRSKGSSHSDLSVVQGGFVEEDEWKKTKSDKSDIAFIILKPKDLLDLDATLLAPLNKRTSMEFPG